ncbi:MAG: S8 family peptidase [Spirochaetia bacterium]|nr:S8 family peptidase [Spirochaetia bacterium]
MEVSSAFLFGPISPGNAIMSPYAPITHIRILDKLSNNESPLVSYRTLGMIQDVLLSRQYEFVNLSIGPDLPIDDHEIHAWTSVIDDALANGKTFMTIAVGNNGEADRSSGNARIEVPSDCVNAVSVGASDSTDSKWKKASYSAIGPGRQPGIVKPDLVAFGGSPQEYFHTLTKGQVPIIVPQMGTSFAAPLLLRTAVGIRAYLGNEFSVLAIKALLIDSAERNGNDRIDVGWGRIPDNLLSLITCGDGTSRIVYQGELIAGKYLRVHIPLPKQLQGMISLKATICYTTEIDPENSDAYTEAGIEVTFRPDKTKNEDGKQATSKSFFSKKIFATEKELRNDAGKWETVLKGKRKFRASSLKEPCFDIHYNARENGMTTSKKNRLHYALIITIQATKTTNITEKIMESYPELVPIIPKSTIPATKIRI